MSETRRRGYRSVSVRAPVFDRLLEIAQREGLNSAAEAVEYLTAKYYEETLLRGTSTIEAVVARLFFNDKRPGEIIESYQGRGAYPLVFLTYEIAKIEGEHASWDYGVDTRFVIRLVIGVNPLPILLTYCPSTGRCDTAQLESDIIAGTHKLIDKALALLSLINARKDLLEMTGTSVAVDKAQLNSLHKNDCVTKKKPSLCSIPLELRIPLENLEAAREHLATVR